MATVIIDNFSAGVSKSKERGGMMVQVKDADSGNSYIIVFRPGPAKEVLEEGRKVTSGLEVAREMPQERPS